MELCVNFFGISFYLIQAGLALVLLLFIFPLITVKIAAKFKLKSVNWLIIGVWIWLYFVWHICYDKDYMNFFSDYLPAVVCENFFNSH